MLLLERLKTSVSITDCYDAKLLKVVKATCIENSNDLYRLIRTLNHMMKLDIKITIKRVENLISSLCRQYHYFYKKEKLDVTTLNFDIRTSNDFSANDNYLTREELQKIAYPVVNNVPGVRLMNNPLLQLNVFSGSWCSYIKLQYNFSLWRPLNSILNKSIKTTLQHAIYEGSNHKMTVKYYNDNLSGSHLNFGLKKSFEISLTKSSIFGLIVTSEGVLGRIEMHHWLGVIIKYTTSLTAMNSLQPSLKLHTTAATLRGNKLKQLDQEYRFDYNTSFKTNITTFCQALDNMIKVPVTVNGITKELALSEYLLDVIYE